MKPFLLYEKYDNSFRREIANGDELIQDLNLHIIFKAMAQNDAFLYDTARSVVLNSLTDIKTILYRQDILKDCINSSLIIHKVYNIVSTALKEAAYYKEYTQPNYARIIPISVRVINSVGLLELLVVKLEELKSLCDLTSKNFQSKGLTSFYRQQAVSLTDEFFIKVKEHIADLKSISEGGKVVIGSRIGNGMKGANHVLRTISKADPKTNPKRIFLKTGKNNVIPLDNTSIANSAREIEDAGLIHILRVINQFTNSIILFFESLRYEIGFYVGCINLYNEFSQIDAALSFPIPEDIDKETLAFKGLYDSSLCIVERKRLVSNDLDAGGKSLFIITGANQGGKSTFLRSIGIAQILMQCGLFVSASFYRANVRDNIFTHFTREEDTTMNSGKLEEELLRMNSIISNITHNSLLLMNESFATTTERDGSRIAGGIITALYEFNIKVLFVTHLFEFADSIYNEKLEKTVFLRAERNNDGSRSYSIKIGEPLQTSYGEDLFKSIIARMNVQE